MTAEITTFGGKRAVSTVGCAAGLFLLFLTNILAGLFLELRYSRSSEMAYADVHAIQTSWLVTLRAFHYWSSALLIAGSFALIVWMVVAMSFGADRMRLWFATWMLFLASLLSQMSGNVLPFDRHGVQTAVIESGVARQMPVAGGFIANLILGGNQFNDTTLGRWHFAHIFFPLLGLLAAGLFWTGCRKEPKGRYLPWIPLALALIAGFIAAAPLGKAATKADYGSFDAQVSWYTWPLHGSLNLFSKISPSLGWLGSGLMPTLFVFFAISLPWLSRKVSVKGIQVVFGVFCAYFGVAALAFGGRPAPLIGSRDPALAGQVVHQSAPVDATLYAKGRELFNGQGCAGCHGQDGTHPTQAPNLAGVASRRGTDPQWYMKFINSPQSVKPNSMMPPFDLLKADETRAIAEFLIHQK